MMKIMCNAHNHPSDCTCGWGGDGSYGGGGGWGGSSGHTGSWSSGSGLLDWRVRLREYTDGLTFPSACRWCGQDVYIYTNEWGSFVVFDELGWPWPKHECAAAPADVREQVRGGNYQPLLPRNFEYLLQMHLLTHVPDRKIVRQVTVARALRQARSKGVLTLSNYLDRLMMVLPRDELAVPVTCHVCQAPVVVLRTTDNPTVLVDDVWTGRLHRCPGGAASGPPAHPAMTQVTDFAAFEKLMSGRTCLQGLPANPAPGGGVTEGLVVEVMGSHVRLLTAERLYKDIPVPGVVRPLDYLRVVVGQVVVQGVRVHTERFAVLRGGEQATRLPGWKRAYRLVRRPVTPPGTH